MAPTVHIRTLGCPKNDADSDLLLGALTRAGYTAVDDSASADVVIVNTCAFIEVARQESVDAILDEVATRRDGQAVVVSGCLVERYGSALADELPEVDAFMALGAYGRAAQIVDAAMAGVKQRCFDPGKVPLDLEHPVDPTGPTAMLKISEGCDRVCTFCAIPAIRGPHRSRAPEAIESELRWLVSRGVHEVVLVGQDMSLYGRDTTGSWQLPQLLRRLGGVDGVGWMRMLYQYPRYVNEKLLEAMAATPSAVPYLDLSLQHASGKLVRKMKRWGDAERFLKMIELIRSYLPDAVLRSSFIVGFPGETDREVEELADFLQAAQLDWAGFFTFSREDGTEAGEFKSGRVPKATAARRAEVLSGMQNEIAEDRREQLIGTKTQVLIESVGGSSAIGRSWREAPEVDGVIAVARASGVRPGDLLDVTISGRDGLDLVARREGTAATTRRRLDLHAV